MPIGVGSANAIGFNQIIGGAAPTPPEPPVQNDITDITDSELTLNWGASTGATGYKIYGFSNAGLTTPLPGFNGLDVGNVLTYDVTGLDPDTDTWWYEKAYNLAGDSSASNTKSATTITAEYQAVLDYATSQGDTLPSSSQQALQNTFVSAMSPYWADLDALAIMATNGDSEFAVTDYIRMLKMTKVNSPTFTSNQGFTGNGSSSYINSRFNLSTASNYSLNNAAIWIYINNNVDSDRILGASNGSTTFTNFRPRSGGQMQANVNDTGSSVFLANTNSTGLWCVQRINSTTLEIYKNGVLFKSGSDSSVGLLNLTLFLLAQSTNGSANSFTTYQIGFFAAGSQQDSTAQAAIYTAWNNYYSAL